MTKGSETSAANAIAAQTMNNTNAALSSLVLGHNGEWWDTFVIISLVFAIVVAGAVAAATAGSVVVHNREAEAARAEAAARIAEAGAAAAKANEGLAKAQADIAAANAIAAQANEKAENERLERVKLEAQIAPRRLSAEQERVMLGALRPMNGPPVVVVSRILDGESHAYAEDFLNVLQEAKWENVSKNWNWTASEHSGLFVGTLEGTVLPQSSVLLRAMERAGLKVSPLTITLDHSQEMSPWFAPGTLYLFVGSHP